MPGETPMPFSRRSPGSRVFLFFCLQMHLMKARGHECQERFHRLLRVLTVSADPDRRATLGGERHHAEDALAVDDGAVFVHLDRRCELVRHFDELRPRPDMHAERINDARVPLDHGHISPTTSATAARTSESRSPLRRSPLSRIPRKLSAATMASATRAQESNDAAR